MKKMTSLLAALCAAMVMSGVQALAKDNATITADQARKFADAMVPSSCAYLTTDYERYLYEVKYFDKTNQEKYTIQVGRSEGDILELTVQSADRGGETVKLTEAEAVQAIRALYSDALDIKASLMEQDGRSYYEVTYRTPFTRGTARVNAETGRIMLRDDVYYQAKNDELKNVVKSSVTSDSLARQAVTRQSIEESALEAVPGGTIDRVQLTGDRTLYEVKMHKGDYEYELLYNAATGARVNMASSFDPPNLDDEWYQNPGVVKKGSPRFGMAQVQNPTAVKSTGSQGTYISREKAVEIARRSAPSGAALKSMSLKHSGGETYYEGWLKKDGIRYAFRIDAVGGSVIDASVEVDETWDPDAHHDVDSIKDEDKDYEMKWDD